MGHGRVSLKRWAEERGYRKAAAALGYGVSTVHAWVNGARTPEVDAQAKIAAVVGIPVEEWAAEAAPKPAVVTLVSALPETASAKSRALAHMLDIEARQRAAREADTSIRDLAVIDAAYSKAIATYGRLSGELELTEAQITRSPAFERLLAVMFKALEPYPVAADAITKALDGIDGVHVEEDE